MKYVYVAALAAILSLGALRLGSGAAHSPIPRDADFSSTREVRSLGVGADGTLWARTSGGALRWQRGAWTKFAAAPLPTASNAPTWRGQSVTWSFDGLTVGGRRVPFPPSRGTHISAVLPRGKALWAAVFGDGIWAWNGARWARPALGLPPQARDITALAQSRDAATVWMGTRRAGVWTLGRGMWRQHVEADEPFASNIQSLQWFRGALWAGTLEDGLVVHDASGWKHIGKGDLSSNAPRQMVVFRGKLYVRHSDEVVDQFDGTTWKRNVFPLLPRKQIISIAADGERLYLGQWGGWSEWDGRTFSHHLRLPELQIVPLLHILPDGKNLWLGTENRGLFRWNRRAHALERFDERDGLPQDWMSALAQSDGVLVAGTFGAGLAWRAKNQTAWHTVPPLSATGISALASDDEGRTWIGTRSGVWCRDARGAITARNLGDKREVQVLLWTPDGLWIGARDGLSFRSRAMLDHFS